MVEEYGVVRIVYPDGDREAYMVVSRLLRRLGFGVREEAGEGFFIEYNGRVWRDSRTALEELARIRIVAGLGEG